MTPSKLAAAGAQEPAGKSDEAGGQQADQLVIHAHREEQNPAEQRGHGLQHARIGFAGGIYGGGETIAGMDRGHLHGDLKPLHQKHDRQTHQQTEAGFAKGPGEQLAQARLGVGQNRPYREQGEGDDQRQAGFDRIGRGAETGDRQEGDESADARQHQQECVQRAEGRPRVISSQWAKRVSVGKPAEVAEQGRGVRNQRTQHPRHGQQQSAQKYQQPRNSAEAGILNRGQDLHQAHDDSDDEAGGQHGQAQHQGRQERVTN